MKNVLVTGASGFIGSFLIEKSLELGYTTWAGIRKSSSKKYLQDKRIKFIDFDLKNKAILKEQLKQFITENGRFDYIIHNAGVTKCLSEKEFEQVNYINTKHFIDVLIELEAIPQKFVLMSSLSALGAWDEINYSSATELTPPNPNTIYGQSKMNAEKYLRSRENFPYIILRPTGVYGPREQDYLMMIKTIKAGFDIGAGFKTQYLTFIYVKDLADVAFATLTSEQTNKIYNISDGNVYTDQEYTSILKKITDKKYVLRLRIPLIVIYTVSIFSEFLSKTAKRPSTLNRDKYKIMKQRNWKCDINSLKHDLNYKPKYSLRLGLEESFAWYRENGWL